jgi:hypothetical protein
MASVLSGSRKYAFGLVLVHQDLQQIHDPALSNSVITNPATRICFALGDNDAQKLQSGFVHFDANDLMNLGVGEAIVRCERNEYDFNLTTYDIPLIAIDIALMKREKIIAHTRKLYGCPIQNFEFQKHLLDKETQPTRLVKKEPEPYISIEPKIEIKPKPEPTVLKKEIPVFSDDLSKRKSLSQHRRIQTFIKKIAEQRGYRALIEESTADGGRVDVGLEREGKKIACEISVTTEDIHELHNIEKCLRSGYDPVIVCASEKKNLETIRKIVIEKLNPMDQTKILFLEPEELVLYLDKQIIQETRQEKRVKGYRVKVQYEDITDAENKQKQGTLAQIVGQSLKRKKSE